MGSELGGGGCSWLQSLLQSGLNKQQSQFRFQAARDRVPLGELLLTRISEALGWVGVSLRPVQ